MDCSNVETDVGCDGFSWASSFLDAFQKEPIALVALLLALVVGVLGWLHNRHSVRPIMRFRVDTTLVPNTVKITLNNVGLGPATITEWSIYKDGDRVQIPKWDTQWDSLLQSIGLSNVTFGYGTITLNETYAPRKDDQQLVLTVSDPLGVESGSVQRDFRPHLNRLDFVCKYKSVYWFSGQKVRYQDPKEYRVFVRHLKAAQAARRAAAAGDAADDEPSA